MSRSEPNDAPLDSSDLARLKARAQAILDRAPMKSMGDEVDDLRSIVEELQVSQIELELQNEELRRTQRNLETARDKYADLFHHSPVGFLNLDHAGIIHDANSTFFFMLGVTPKALLRKPLSAFVARESRNHFFSRFLPFYRSPESCPIEVWLSAPQGNRFLARLEGRRIESGDEGDQGEGDLRVSIIDNTAHHQSEERLRLSSAVLHATSEGVVVTDADQKIIDVNESFSRSTGYTLEEVVGRRPHLLKSGRHDRGFYREMWRAIDEDGSWRGEIWNRRKNGEIYPEWLNITAIKNDAGVITSYAGIFSDLSAQESVRQRLHHLAYYDGLTDLPNRQLCLDRLRNAIVQARRSGGKVGVAFIDIDRFKTINDTLGHQTGDQVICEVAKRLTETVRETDTVARLGGDEFVIIFSAVHKVAEVGRMIRKLRSRFEEPLSVGVEKPLFVTISVGVTLYPDDGTQWEDLLRNADHAMYRAKQEGRNRERFYAHDLDQRDTDRVSLETDFRNALDHNEITLAYQPIISAASGKIVSVEALARWRSETRGFVGPDTFVPLAEEIGLIARMGERCLKLGLNRLAHWRKRHPTLQVAVNVSALQVKEISFYNTVQSLLRDSGADPNGLLIELTESALMTHRVTAHKMIENLSTSGVRFAIDDFGTGYSSLAYLKQFPLDHVKIDRSFVSEIVSDPTAASICRAIVAMAHSLGLAVVAEGIETPDQLHHLRELDCDYLQGYLFSRPVPPEEIDQMIEHGATFDLENILHG